MESQFQKSWNCLGDPTSQGSSPASSSGSSSGSNNVFAQSPRTITDGNPSTVLGPQKFTSTYGANYGRGSRLAKASDMDPAVTDTVRNLQFLHNQMSTSGRGSPEMPASSSANHYPNNALEYFQPSSGNGGGYGGGGAYSGSGGPRHPMGGVNANSAASAENMALERAARMHRNGTGIDKCISSRLSGPTW